jgi:F-type H+-transporting ATPase subunit b
MVSIDIDSSLFWQIGNFLVLLVALNYLLYRPIRGIIKQRAEKVAQLNGDITSSEEGAKAKQAELEAEMAEARRQGAEVREEMKGEGHSKEREIIDAATAEMEKAVAKVREEISAEIGKARDELKGQVQSFGRELAQKLLGRSLQ